jgi:hypothetical protein
MSRSKKDKENNEQKKDNCQKNSKSSTPAITKNEMAVVEELLRSAINEYTIKFDNKKLERAETAQRLSSFIGEFLSAFMIIGYDMQGNPFNLIHAINQMDADALSSALNKFIFNLNTTDD